MPVPTEEILAHLDHTHERRKPVGLEWWRGLRWFTASALFVLVSIGLPSLAGYHWNLSRSLPLGLYAEVERPLLVGELVAVCLPPAVAQFGVDRGYVEHGGCADGVQPVLKRIAAVAGDIVDVQPEGVTITLQQTHAIPHRVANSAVLAHDRQGRPLPHVPWGPYTLQHGELWLLSTTKANSWDSRYFGPVSAFDVLATMRPVLTIAAERRCS